MDDERPNFAPDGNSQVGGPDDDTVSLAKAVLGLRDLRKKYLVDPGEIKEFIEDGRR